MEMSDGDPLLLDDIPGLKTLIITNLDPPRNIQRDLVLLTFDQRSFLDMRPATNSFSWYTKVPFSTDSKELPGISSVFSQKGCYSPKTFWYQGRTQHRRRKKKLPPDPMRLCETFTQ